MNTNCMKCLGKGMNNFIENGGNLDHLEYYNLRVYGNSDLIQ